MASGHAVSQSPSKSRTPTLADFAQVENPLLLGACSNNLHQIQVEFFFYAKKEGTVVTVFCSNVPYCEPFHIIFLCGSKYRARNTRDKRIVLKQHLEKKYPNTYAIILEHNFWFRKTNTRYLSYDDIFLKNLAQIEQLASLYADRIIIIHETLSTAAELGLFAANPLLAPKVCILTPDFASVEEDKAGGFIQLAFLKEGAPESKVKLVRYWPDTEIHRNSVNKSDYYTFFHEDMIGDALAERLDSFVQPASNATEFVFQKSHFGKPNSDPAILDYFRNSEDQVKVSVPVEILKMQLLALFFHKPVKAQLQQAKRIQEHVTTLERAYQDILTDTLRYLEGKVYVTQPIKVSVKGTPCDLRQAVGYFLYMLQGAGLIHLEQTGKDSSDRKVGYTINFRMLEDTASKFLWEEKPTAFGGLKL